MCTVLGDTTEHNYGVGSIDLAPFFCYHHFMSRASRRNRRDTNAISNLDNNRLIDETLRDLDDRIEVRTDNRTFNPSRAYERVRPAVKFISTKRVLSNQNRRIVNRLPKRGSDFKRGVDFLSAGDWIQHPRQAYVCMKRAIRRQVLFAKGKGGSGSRRPDRKPKYNDDSIIKCRR